jgi:hypothetical protein
MKTIALAAIETPRFSKIVYIDACDYPSGGYVEGEFQMSTSSEVFDFLGAINPDYYGYCQVNNLEERFEFEIGDAARVDVDSATEIYIKFTDIVGPPTEGVYSDAAAKIPKDDESLQTFFGHAIIKNGGNQFSFNQPDPADNANCYVELFGHAASGEETPTEELPFEYYVSLHCTSLDGVEDSGGQPLTAFNGYFFFAGCGIVD